MDFTHTIKTSGEIVITCAQVIAMRDHLAKTLFPAMLKSGDQWGFSMVTGAVNCYAMDHSDGTGKDLVDALVKRTGRGWKYDPVSTHVTGYGAVSGMGQAIEVKDLGLLFSATYIEELADYIVELIKDFGYEIGR